MAHVPTSFLWRSGALLTATGMIAGAFGSHGLKGRLDPGQLQAWHTAANYAIFNGIALFAISLHPRFAAHRFAGPAIAAGGLVFSSSIFVLTLNRDRFRFLGPITPMGGAAMIAGYIALAL